MNKKLGFVALGLAVALTVAGCGNDTSSDSSASGSGAAKFNGADVTFAQSMIPHHEQAVEMARLGQRHASTAQVKQLAEEIEGAQGPEITTMTGWLKAWGKKVPTDSMSGKDQSSAEMPGMMSDDDMKKLGSARGPAFDHMFLTLMVSHHAGAIDMAETEAKDGKNSDAVTLAKKIAADQTAQIAAMRKLLTS